jgi:putative transposase
MVNYNIIYMGNNRIPLIPENYYHVYNHAVAKNQLFVSHENYLYFLKKMNEHICPVVDIFAYCLMPNHFHLALRIKQEQEIISNQHPQGFKNPVDVGKDLSHIFGNLFNSYSKAFNKQQNRRGNLFIPNFDRKRVDNDIYLKNLIHYIHFNPVHHGFVNDLRDWKYSSFHSFLSKKESSLKRDEVISWFGDIQNFIEFHNKEIDGKMALELEENII